MPFTSILLPRSLEYNLNRLTKKQNNANSSIQGFSEMFLAYQLEKGSSREKNLNVKDVNKLSFFVLSDHFVPLRFPSVFALF